MAPSRSSQGREEFRVFEEYLSNNGLKHSRQREVILQYFLETGGHMTVDDLYRVIHRKHPEIGRTTIYRTLKYKKYTTALPGAPDGEYVVLQFETSFQNKKFAMEKVTPMRDRDGKWRVSGYYIK